MCRVKRALVIQAQQEHKVLALVGRVFKLVHLQPNGRIAKAKHCPQRPRFAETKSTTTATEKPTQKIKPCVAVIPDKPANVTQAPQEPKASASAKKARNSAMQAVHGALAKTKSFLASKRSAETNWTITAMARPIQMMPLSANVSPTKHGLVIPALRVQMEKVNAKQEPKPAEPTENGEPAKAISCPLPKSAMGKTTTAMEH